jgi:hypothetical protein
MRPTPTSAPENVDLEVISVFFVRTSKGAPESPILDLLMEVVGIYPLVVWTSLGPLPQWVPRPTTRWAPGTTRLVPHGS